MFMKPDITVIEGEGGAGEENREGEPRDRGRHQHAQDGGRLHRQAALPPQGPGRAQQTSQSDF